MISDSLAILPVLKKKEKLSLLHYKWILNNLFFFNVLVPKITRFNVFSEILRFNRTLI